jgi:UDP-N-acetylglucosamine 4,6-dehydratase
MEALWEATGKPSRLSPIIGAVEDLDRLRLAMRRVTHVIHAAAQKVVPLAEYNPWQCLQTNVSGSYNVVRSCLDTGVSHAVLVSTDKASAPATLYGASKLAAERLWTGSASYSAGSSTVFSAVRYGNVWRSKGSVIERWESSDQIEITDPQMTRFHLTLSEAVSFVLEASADGEPGELRIPRIPSYRLGDLALAYQSLSSKPTKIIGIRKSEKRHESLISIDESISAQQPAPRASYVSLYPGRVLSDGDWDYTSGSNTHRLSVGALTDMLEKEMKA